MPASPLTERVLTAIASVVAGIILVAILNLALPADSLAGRLLVDKAVVVSDSGETVAVTRPFSIQTFIWLAFFYGLGEVLLRMVSASRDKAQLAGGLLPEFDDVLLTKSDLVPIYKTASQRDPSLFLPRLVRRICLQFQASESVSQSHALLSSSLDLFHEEVDLRYNMLRYIAWLIPTLGFLGTVIGVANGLDTATLQFAETGGDIDLAAVTGALGTAFYTTWLALILAGVLLFLTHLAEGREESTLNCAAQYCLDHLVNKLYIPRK